MVRPPRPSLKMAAVPYYLLVALFLSFVHYTLGGSATLVPMSKYQIDLDVSPDRRWIPLLEHFKSSAPLVVDYFQQFVPSKMEQEVLEKIMADLDKYLGEYGQEMKAIADYWTIDLGIIVGLNFAYEFRRLGGGHPNITNGSEPNPPQYRPSACTSIVAQDSGGHVYHGRNLDWSIPNDLRNLTVQVEFIRSGKVLYTGVVTAGFVGILTGIHPDGYSISINERDLGGEVVIDFLEGVLEGAWSPTHLVRKTFETAANYDQSLQMLSKEKVTAPVYYITAGKAPGCGTVLTRDRNFLRDMWTLSPTSTPADWYRLQTNYDHWKKVDPYDNRRYYGNLYMERLGLKDGATLNGLFKVLTEWPIQNNYTSLTVLMDPLKYTIQAYNVYTPKQ